MKDSATSSKKVRKLIETLTDICPIFLLQYKTRTFSPLKRKGITITKNRHRNERKIETVVHFGLDFNQEGERRATLTFFLVQTRNLFVQTRLALSFHKFQPEGVTITKQKWKNDWKRFRFRFLQTSPKTVHLVVVGFLSHDQEREGKNDWGNNEWILR